MGNLELSKVICVVSIFCIAAAIASPAQTFTTVANFGLTDGSGPNARLVQGTDGKLYGTTGNGGSNCPRFGCGTVFTVTTSGTLTTLYSFDGTDGSFATGLVQGTDRNFYGTTANGGVNNNCTNGCGTVRVGTKVTILGNNLAGATSVTFNGTQATFKASSTYITTTVPTGATTGKVEVVTPKKTLKSTAPFRVP